VARVSGISGSDLKKRIICIVTRRLGVNLTLGRKLLLAAAGIAAIAGPLVLGVVDAPLLLAQSTGPTGVQTAQSSDTPTPSFEVVSIKPNPDRSPYAMGGAGGDLGHEMMRLATAKTLITFAYNLRGFQVSGGPAWISSDRFDVDAKVDEATVAKLQAMTPDQRLAYRRLMYQSVLADRFKLKVHRIMTQEPLYSLIVTKPEKIHEAQNNCQGDQSALSPTQRCGGGEVWSGHIIENTVPIASLVGTLTTVTGKTVLDNTGLTGKYSFTLDWTPDSARLGPPDPNSPFPAPDPNGPSLQEVLEEKFGLKLVSTTGPVENIIIDDIKEPSPN
jgi:bla regulator protein blaR1